MLLQSVLVLYWARLGSLHALETVRGASFWKRWLGRALASADTVGRVHAELENEGLRQGLQQVYGRLKRNKALRGVGEWDIAVLDGHENHASYRRHCRGCLKRTLRTEQGEKVQFYHRQVTLMLRCEKLRLLLDVEAQLPGESEVATALRLLERVLQAYPRAFQLLLGDALYAQAPFLNFLIRHGKQALLVLKQERRDLYQDVLGILPLVVPQKGQYRSRDCLWVAGERPGAGGALGRNLPSAPPVGQTTVPGEERMDVGDDLAGRASLHRAGRSSGTCALGHRKLWLQ